MVKELFTRIQDLPNLRTVQKGRSREHSAVVTLVGKVDFRSTPRAIDHSKKGKLEHL